MRHAFLWIKSATLTAAAAVCLIASSAPAAQAQDVFGSMIGALTGGIGGGTKSTKSGDGAPNKNDSVEGMQERRYSYLESAEGAGARASTQPSYGYGGSDVRDAKGAAQSGMITGARLNGTLYSEVPMLPLAGINFPVASKAQENEMYTHCPPLTGYHLTDSADYINTAIANDVLLGKLSDPERWVNVSKATQQAQNTQMGNALAELTRNQANSAIDFCSTYLTNFTTSKQWNAIRDKLFIPIALLLLLPGAMLSQVKAIIAAGTPVLEETQPFEGLLRSIIAIFLIPATCLVLNYGIDLSNSLTYTIKTQYKAIFGDDMYESAICAEVRAFPVRQEAENRGALDVQTSKMGQLLPEAKTTFAKVEGQLFSTKLEDPCAGLYVAPSDRVDEALPTNVVAARLAFNGINAALTCGWNALCAFQVVYLYYLWLMGPIVAALWVWPMKMFRDALPSWIEGCVTLCFWSLLWNTTILLMACFRGYDETGTIMMTAMNTLATLCVKCAFDFVGLVAAAGQQASSIGAKMSEAIGKGAAGAGGTSGHGATGRSSAGLGGHGGAVTHAGGSSVHGGSSVVHGGESATSVLGSHSGTGGGAGVLGSHGGASGNNGAGGMHLSGSPNGHLSLTSHSINPSGLGSTQIHNSAISSGLSSHIQPPPGSATHELIGGLAGGENVHSALGNIMHNMPEGFSLPPSSIESVGGIGGFDMVNNMTESAFNSSVENVLGGVTEFAQMPGAQAQDAIFNTMNASTHLGGNLGDIVNASTNFGGSVDNVVNSAMHVAGGTDVFNNATMGAIGGAIPGVNSFVSNNMTENAGAAAVWNSVDGSQIDLGLDVAGDMSQMNLDNGINIAAETVMANGDFQVSMDQVFDNSSNSSAVLNANGGTTVFGGEQTDNSSSVMNNNVQNALASDIINNAENMMNVNGGVVGDVNSIVNQGTDNSMLINNAGSMATMNASSFSNAVANDFNSSVVNAGYSYSSGDANSYSSAYTTQTAAYNSDVVNSTNIVANNVGGMVQSSVAGDVVNNGSNMQSNINAVNAAEIYNQANSLASIDASSVSTNSSSNSYAEYAQQQIQQYQQYQQSQAQVSPAAYYTDNSTSANVAASVGRDMQASIANSLTNDVVQRNQEQQQQQQMYANLADAQSVQQPATVGASACTTFTAAAEAGSPAIAYVSAAPTQFASTSNEYIPTSAAPTVANTTASSEYIPAAAAAPSVASLSAASEYVSSPLAAAFTPASTGAQVDYSAATAAVSVVQGQPLVHSATQEQNADRRSDAALAPTGSEVLSQSHSAPTASAPPVSAPEVVVVPTSNFATPRPAALEEVVKQSFAQNAKEGKEAANSDKAEPLYVPSAKPQSKLTSALRSAACPSPQTASQAIPMPPSSTATPASEEPAPTGNTVFSPLDIAAVTTRNRYRGQRKMTEEELRQLKESTSSWWT